MKTKIHSTAIIDKSSEIETGVEIGPYCIVHKGVRIRKGARLIANVIVDGNTDIGEDCTIYPFSSIGFPPQDLKYKNEPTKLVIGSKNIIREYVTLHRGSVGGEGVTSVGAGNFLMAYVHVAHDCKVGSNIVMANAATLAGHVVVEDFVVIGGVAAIHQYTRVGRYAMVGGFSGITQDVPPYTIASGPRAKLFGLNTIGLKRHGFPDTTINTLKKAYKILFREKNTLKEAIKIISSDLPAIDEIKYLIEFIEKNKRGICR